MLKNKLKEIYYQGQNRIRHSRKLGWLYNQYMDFEHGRGFAGKFTGLTSEFNFAILVSTFLFGINLRDHIPEAIKWTLICIFSVYIFGKFYWKFKLQEVEDRAHANRNPVEKIKLEAAEIIIDRFGGKK